MKDNISKVNPYNTQPKMKVSWDYYDYLVEKLYLSIPDKKYTAIAGIPRGGLILAVMLSHRLNLPLIDLEYMNKKTLVVDDICDSGVTLSKLPKKIDVATLFLRKESMVQPKYYAQELYGDEWLIFPYEINPVSSEKQKRP